MQARRRRAPHAGGVVTIGYRFRPWLLVGLSCEFGLLRWDVTMNFHRGPACSPGRCEGPVRAPAFGHHSLLGLMLGVTIGAAANGANPPGACPRSAVALRFRRLPHKQPA